VPHTNIWEPNGLYRKFIGEVSGDEILDSNLTLHVHPEFKQINYVINDFTEITGLLIDNGHTKTYARVDGIISCIKDKLKIAIVTQADHIALANDYCEHMKDRVFECGIFQILEDARNWANSE
jgi:hypothetical protein